jgi:hypothetical protein
MARPKNCGTIGSALVNKQQTANQNKWRAAGFSFFILAPHCNNGSQSAFGSL